MLKILLFGYVDCCGIKPDNLSPSCGQPIQVIFLHFGFIDCARFTGREWERDAAKMGSDPVCILEHGSPWAVRPFMARCLATLILDTFF